MFAECLGQVSRQNSTSNPSRLLILGNMHRTDVPHVDDQAVLELTAPEYVVSARAYDKINVLRDRVTDELLDMAAILRPDDGCRSWC